LLRRLLCLLLRRRQSRFSQGPVSRISSLHEGFTNGGGAAHAVGKIAPKKAVAETEQALIDSDALFDITFPPDANAGEKGMLMGTAIFLNAKFFEGGDAH
jgi:hypothetical protein